MAYSVSNLKNDLSGVLHGTTNNQIQNLDGLINRAARQLLLDVDPQETKRTLEFVNPIFNTVTDYPIADDVKGNKIIDIFPQVQRLPRDIWLQSYNQAFDVAKQNFFSLVNMFTMNFNTGLKTIRLNAPFLNPPVIINQAEAVSTNGTWSAGGTASNLTTNNTNFVQGAGSLQFDVAAGQGDVQNFTSNPVNLMAYVNQSSLFVWIYVPTGSQLSNVGLTWGSSAADYYNLATTTNQQGVAFVNGWNLCEFPWKLASTNGSPDATQITYLNVTLQMTGVNTGVLVNGIESILGTILSYEYYSKFLFRDVITGAFQENITADTNLVNLDTESYNLLFNLVAHFAGQQQQGVDASFYDGQFFMTQYQQCLAKYKSMYKSEVQKPKGQYYYQPNTSYNQYLGRNWNG